MPGSWRALEAVETETEESAPARRGSRGESEMVEVVPVLLADSGRLFREGLASLLSEQPGIEVLGHTASVEDSLAALALHSSAIVLMGCHLPRGVCLEGVRQLVAADRTARIVLLVSTQDTDFLRRAARAGALGVVSDAVDGSQLGALLRALHGGQPIESPYYITLQGDGAAASRGGPEERRLTRQERRVLAGVTEGHTNREIARTLGISQDTVKAHLKSIFAKLKAKSRTEAAVTGLQWGLLDEPPNPETGTNGKARARAKRSRKGSAGRSGGSRG